MKLDRTFIAIRERSILDIFDLSLQVTRQYARPLTGLLIVGAVPWFVINWLVLGWLATPFNYADHSLTFFALMTILVISQANIGTSMISHFLGMAMFVQEQSMRQTIREVVRSSFYFWWNHGVIRLVLPILGLIGWCIYEGNTWFPMAVFLGGFMMILVVGARGIRPFVNEILLLEKTPVRPTQHQQITYSKRSSNLHSNAGGELFGRLITTSIFFVFIFFSIYSMFTTIDWVLLIQPTLEFPMKTVYWTVALWITAGFAAVLRFLSYVDIRIRQEGWAVELKMRAEGIRLNGGES